MEGGWEAEAAGEAEEGDDKSTMQAGGNRVRQISSPPPTR